MQGKNIYRYFFFQNKRDNRVYISTRVFVALMGVVFCLLLIVTFVVFPELAHYEKSRINENCGKDCCAVISLCLNLKLCGWMRRLALVIGMFETYEMAWHMAR